MLKIIKNSLGFDSDLYIYQDKSMFNYSVDTILLGNFVFLNNKINHTLEVGTNNGALAIFLAARNNLLHIDALEIQTKAANLAQENVKLNKMENQITVINEDFKEYWIKHNKNDLKKYQSIICNPPFYQSTKTKIKSNLSQEILIATHDLMLSLEDLVLGASKIIEQKGYLNIVLPVERSIDLFVTLRKYNFEPKRIQYVFTRMQNKPKFILVEARYQTGAGTHFLPNLYLHDPKDKLNHDYLPEIKKLYKPIKVNKEQ